MEKLYTLTSKSYISQLKGKNIRVELEKLKGTVPVEVLALIEKEILNLSPEIDIFNIFNATGLKLNLNDLYAYKSSFLLSPNGRYLLASGRSDYINDILIDLKMYIKKYTYYDTNEFVEEDDYEGEEAYVDAEEYVIRRFGAEMLYPGFSDDSSSLIYTDKVNRQIYTFDINTSTITPYIPQYADKVDDPKSPVPNSPVKIRYFYGILEGSYNYKWIKDNKFIMWSNQIIYYYDSITGWKSLVKLSGNNGIYFVEVHNSGLLIHWSKNIKFNSKDTMLDVKEKSDVINHGPILGNPLVMPGYFGQNEVLLSNYDFDSHKITFHLDISDHNSFYGSASFIDNDVFYYRTYRENFVIYDDAKKIIPYSFNVEYARGNTLMIDTVLTQFRLLEETFEHHMGGFVQYHSDKDGLYMISSWGTGYNESTILPSVIYYDRRISFLKRLVDYKSMFGKRNIPLPAVYPNDLVLEKMLYLYGQQPNDMFKYDLGYGVMDSETFESIIENIFS